MKSNAQELARNPDWRTALGKLRAELEELEAEEELSPWARQRADEIRALIRGSERAILIGFLDGGEKTYARLVARYDHAMLWDAFSRGVSVLARDPWLARLSRWFMMRSRRIRRRLEKLLSWLEGAPGVQR